jgi:hypothetical protein
MGVMAMISHQDAFSFRRHGNNMLSGRSVFLGVNAMICYQDAMSFWANGNDMI